jgi:hypothetical protein
MLASAGIALVGDFSARSTAFAIFSGACTLAALVGVTWSTTNVVRLVVIVAVSSGTAMVVLLGILSFGPLFLPALVLWCSAGLVQWHGEHPPNLLLVTASLWGIGIALIGSIAIPAIIGYIKLNPIIAG